MEKYIGIFAAIGINENAAKLYLTLLEHGEKTIAELTKLSGLYRMEIYRQLPLLLETGLLLTVTRGKRKTFLAANPYKIQDIAREQQEVQETHIEQLVEKYSYLEKKPRVIYQEGKKGIMGVFSDIVNTLEKGDVFYRISSEKDVEKANSYLPKDYREKRDAKQLERYVIMSASGAMKKLPRLERELITIPAELDDFEDNISLSIYGNKIAYIDFSTESSIIIEHQALADFHKKMFRMLYVSLRK